MDITLLRETIGNNTDLMKRMMELFINTAPELMGKIKEAADGNDSAALRLNAHSLKGSLSYFTKHAPFTTSFEVEQIGAKGIEAFDGDLAALIGNLEGEVEKLIEEMRKYLCDQI